MDGFVIEAGTDTLLVVKPQAGALVDALGLRGRLAGPRSNSGRSYVLHEGELPPVPDGLAGVVPTRLWPMLATRLLSLVGRARMALEIVVPRRAGKDDEPLGMFITRRLGRQTFERLVEPMVAGMHPGNVATLSLRATFPNLRRDEVEHGGLARAVLRRTVGDWRRVRAGRRTDPASNGSGGPTKIVPTGSGPAETPVAAPLTGMAEIVEEPGTAAAPPVQQ
ncbi:MAG TPA: FAD-dependent oxidoreductase [Kineosporiaceae bacterium]|nr:FAD-dependent oxidoreductase [Kineosporiaceae bacterium]